MKKIVFKPIMMLAVMFIMLFASFSCDDLLNNPLKDKETGEDIPLLLVDINFFKTSFTVNLIDESTGDILETEARIWVSGPDSSCVINFAGERKTATNDEGITEVSYTTKVGSVELTCDPNVKPTDADPINLTFWADQIGGKTSKYEANSIDVQYSTEGQKTINITVSKLPEEDAPLEEGEEDIVLEGSFDEDDGFVFGASLENLKSTTADPEYNSKLKISKADAFKLLDANKKPIFTSNDDMKNVTPTIILRQSFPGSTKIKTIGNKKYLLRDMEKATLKSITFYNASLDKKMKVSYLNGAKVKRIVSWNEKKSDIIGIRDSKGISDTIYNIASFLKFHWVYSASEITTCNTGASITFESDAIGVNFNLDAVFYNINGKKVGGSSFVGSFNQKFLLENVTSDPAIIKFKKNYFAFNPIDDISVESLCGGDIKVKVTPAANYNIYDITLVAFCPENPTAGLSPTYSAQYRPINSENSIAWQGVKMEGGHFRILARENAEYQIRLTFDGKTEYVDISTNMAELNAKIDTEVTNIQDKGIIDGIHYLKITHKFVDDCPFSL